MSLKFYNDFWRHFERSTGRDRAATMQRLRRNILGTASEFGSGDDPIGTMTAFAQNEQIGALVQRGTRGGMDTGAIYDVIDHTLNFEENVSLVLDAGGKPVPSEERRQRREAVRRGEREARRSARDAIQSLCRTLNPDTLEDIMEGFEPEAPDVIDVGEIEQTLQDIEDAFGEDFVAGVIADCRVMFADELMEAATEPLPEPKPEPEPQETPSIAPEPEPEQVPEETLVGRALSLMRE